MFRLDAAVTPTEGVVSAPAKISPPSYSTVAGPAYQHHNNLTSPLTSPPFSSSYPAVLVGRANSESKPKIPPPVPPRGTPKVKRGGATTTTTSVGKGDGSLHDVLRFPLLLHDAMDTIKNLVRGRVFADKCDGCFDSDGEGVRLKYFGRFVEGRRSAISENAYYSPSSQKIYVDDDICRVDMDE